MLDSRTRCVLVACLPILGARVQTPTSIQVHDALSGCNLSDFRDYEWVEQEDGYSFKGEHVTRADVEALRKIVLESCGVPNDLLDRIGFTQATLQAHRQDVLRAARPDTRRPKGAGPLWLPPELEGLLTYDKLAPHVLAEVQGQNWLSTNQYSLRITIPGDPAISIQSVGEVAWKLPWSIQVGSKKWSSSDPALSRALLRLVDRDGPNAFLLDGTKYWSERFWQDGRFWRCWVNAELAAAWSEALYSKLDGYKVAMERFKIERTESVWIGMFPNSLFLGMRPRQPSTIDNVLWWNPLRNDKPKCSWVDFVRVFDASLRSVEKQPWLKEWKLARPDRTIEVHFAGTLGYSERLRKDIVSPSWKDAGLQGEPALELILRHKDQWCGMVWLSGSGDCALISEMHTDVGPCWLDSLHLAYPSYAFVDADGRRTTKILQ